jgi:hypothetical protein
LTNDQSVILEDLIKWLPDDDIPESNISIFEIVIICRIAQTNITIITVLLVSYGKMS